MFEENNKDKQAELFDNLSGPDKKINSKKFILPKFSLSLSCENSFFIIIVLAMLMIACYSLGVENGKHLVLLNNNGIVNNIEEQEEKTQAGPAEPGLNEPKKERTRLETAQPQKIEPAPVSKKEPRKKPYIQVATFRTDKYADKEIKRLESKGYQPFIVSQGKFRQVCVGGYKDKTDAEKALRKLRALYADCILRK
ncbi:MAG: SPOR domain-containing protein [Candidatus Omnitrophota bacterium]